MIPSHPPSTNAGANPATKRKTPEDGEGVLRNAKKSKQESSSSSTNPKRKHEKLGGLVIVRGPQRQPSSQSDSQPSSSRVGPIHQSSDQASTSNPPSSSTQHVPPPTRQTKPNSSVPPGRPRKKGKEREITDAAPNGAAEPDVDEDVRRMNSEADDLRDRSRASLASMTPAAQRVQLEIPAPSTNLGKSRIRQLQVQDKSGKSGPLGTPPPKSAPKDIMLPLPERDTPQIVKNRLMRGESGSKRGPSNLSAGGSAVNGTSGPDDSTSSTRRRSSLGRGKRVSANFDTGIITRPHTSVADSSLYKHIDPELPEPQRMRQLLIWTASRSTHEIPNSQSSSQRRKSTPRTQALNSSLPPLPPGGEEVLRKVEDDIIKMLAEGRIETNVYSPPGESSKKGNVKENEQNVKNKAREKLFTEQIEERKQEDVAWAEVAQFYNAHQQNVLSSLHQRQRARTPTSSKVKGKQRASSHEPDEVDAEPWENELPDGMRKGYEVARQLLTVGFEGAGKTERGLDALQFKEDSLHTAVCASHQLANMASSTLSHRFSLLRLSRSQRTDPLSIPTTAPDPSALSNFVPFETNPSSSSQPLSSSRAPDPQDLLRTISQADAVRPRSKVGDAARRAARDVQRVEESYAASANAESSAGVGGTAGLNQSQQYHRKLTDVPPPTPRKPPGTPRRPSTPGTGRKG